MGVVTELNRSRLLHNKHVKLLTKNHIMYTDQFKLAALQKYEEGYSSYEIWKESGFTLSDFDENYFRKALSRWKQQLKKDPQNFAKEQRGRKRYSRHFPSIEAENAYLRAENTFLKELRALEEELGQEDGLC